MATPSIFELSRNSETIMKREQVKKEVDEYDNLFKGSDSSEKRKEGYMTMVNNFYDLVTDFYEYGWGESFHFANRFKGESFRESIMRSEHFLALKLQLSQGQKVLDVGCGVGGPLRAIAKFSGAHITGLNNNDYQIKRGTKQTNSAGLFNCNFLKADFMNIPIADNTYDACYAIESTCHSPDKTKTFKEILRVMKPGALFTGYEWCMTKKFNPNNQEHQAIKFGIEEGNGLPDIAMEQDVVDALKAAGFEVIEAYSMHEGVHRPEELPWYLSLSGDYSSIGNFRHTPIGMGLTHVMVTTLEKVGIAPTGTTRVSEMLYETAKALVRSGQLEIFTPDYFFLARKPASASEE